MSSIHSLLSSRSNRTLRSGLLTALASVAFAGSAAAQTTPAAPATTPAAPVAAPGTPAAPVAAPGTPGAEVVAPPVTEPAPADPAPVAAPIEQPAPVAEPKPETKDAKKDAKPPLEASYDKGLAFATADGKYEAKLALRTQFRLETTRPLEDGSEFASRFSVNRARFQLEGHVHGKDNRYKLELALDDAGGFTFTKDIFIERQFGKVWARVGQWKRPYSRQEMTSDFSSEFNERSVANEFAGGGRDVGFAIHNDYEKSPEGLEWVVGIFNGFAGGSDRPTQTGTTTCTTDAAGAVRCTTAVGRPTNLPADFGPTFVVRAGFNFGKIKGYSETDLEGGALRYSVAAAYKVSLANFVQGAQDSKPENFSHAAQVDAIIKNEGLDVSVGGYLQKLPGLDTEFGALLQGGYFLSPKVTQIGLRFAIAEVSNSDREQLEVRGAFNYYISGHALKLATDFGFTQLTGENATGVSDDPDLSARVMAQLTF
jgi:Phosphate-selective porin O and P